MDRAVSPLRRAACALIAVTSLAACGAAVPTARHGVVIAVGAENQYANVIAQIGGRYAAVSSIENNPNTDPHSFEASPSIAQAVGAARLIVQNGAGYDTFMDNIEAASSSSGRTIIDVQRLLGLPASLPNPHLWYRPSTMPRLATAIARALSALEPVHAAYFAARARRFDASLDPWYEAMRAFAKRYPHVAVATTEPVGDYLLEALGTVDRTPFPLQADIMNGLDPAPENVSLQDALFAEHRVKALVYNEQVTDSVTATFLTAAKRAGIPVVGVYETMPAGYDYQSWMLAEVRALQLAVADDRSTERL